MNVAVPATTSDALPAHAPNGDVARRAFVSASESDALLPSILRQTIATGLRRPTDIAFSNEGVLFYAERAAGLFVQRPGQPAVAVTGLQKFGDLRAVRTLALTVDPEFARNRFVYVLVTASAGADASCRVLRLTLSEHSTTVTDRKDILIAPVAMMGSSTLPNDAALGGGLRFGPDGFLYVGLGRDDATALPLYPRSLAGKVLRIDREGNGAAGNRPPDGFDDRVYAYGFQNPVAFAFHAETEKLLVAQRRGRGMPDELRWSPLSSDVKRGNVRCSPERRGECMTAAESREADGWQAAKAGDGLSGVARLKGQMWGGWRNGFVAAFDNAQRLDFVKFDALGRALQSATVLGSLGVGIKAVTQGPDDALYVLTNGKPGGDEIWRLSPQ